MKTTWIALAAAAALAAPAGAQDEGGEAKQRVVEKLNSMRVSLDFASAPLDDVIAYLRDFSGINIHVTDEVRGKFSEEQLRVTIKVKDLPLKSALKLVLAGRDLGAVYKEGVVQITTKENAQSALVTRVYDVRDLLFKIQDFPGPRVELANPSGGAGNLGASFTIDEESVSPITEDFITEIVKSNTGDKSWEEGGASITLANGLMVVSQNKRVHGEVGRLLDMLRQFK